MVFTSHTLTCCCGVNPIYRVAWARKIAVDNTGKTQEMLQPIEDVPAFYPLSSPLVNTNGMSPQWSVVSSMPKSPSQSSMHHTTMDDYIVTEGR